MDTTLQDSALTFKDRKSQSGQSIEWAKKTEGHAVLDLQGSGVISRDASMGEQGQSEEMDRERQQRSDSTSAKNALDKLNTHMSSSYRSESMKQLPGVTDRDSSNSRISSAVQM